MPDVPRSGVGQAMEGWAVIRLFVGLILAIASPLLAQSPAARLAPPTPPPTVRASEPDRLEDSRQPAARLGTITAARIGDVPDDASKEERFNWGTPRDRKAIPASRRSERDYDDQDYDRRGARLRTPVPGKTTGGNRNRDPGPASADAPIPGGPAAPPPPPWWPERERDLADIRDQLPAFGDNRDRLAFASDCAFDDFISPITNPFLAEDPRSLTELRPIFLYQTIPTNQYWYQGGSVSFLGPQARLALTDRFSFVIHKLGGTSLSKGDNALVAEGSGFSEIWLGPKFTFWRDADAQRIASAGLQFQLPIGSADVFQDTGTIALVPYVSFARELGQSRFGMVRMINVVGYHLGTDNMRSDYFFDTFHMNLDAGDFKRFYPTLELSWFHYTTAGEQRPFLSFEGRDLANIGGSAKDRDFLTVAPGFRYKFTEAIQMGAAIELPLLGTRDLLQTRITLDLIWRY
jgi:hypothetical protein